MDRRCNSSAGCRPRRSAHRRRRRRGRRRAWPGTTRTYAIHVLQERGVPAVPALAPSAPHPRRLAGPDAHLRPPLPPPLQTLIFGLLFSEDGSHQRQ